MEIERDKLKIRREKEERNEERRKNWEREKNVEQEKAKQIVITTEWQKETGNQKIFFKDD
jgi:hypothetical protein